MNKKLKFSWAHIIAFVAIIFYAYITFVGATYLFDCKFWLSGTVTFLIVALIFFLFMGVQQLKATDENFSKKIVWERTLMVGTVVLFILTIHPFMHSWHVQKNHAAIETQFSDSVKASRQLFVKYEQYSQDRIDKYSTLMDGIIAGYGQNRSKYNKFGFEKQYEAKQKELRMQTLRLQLLSSNYVQLREKAYSWIVKADRKACIWNIFLVGNIDQIKAAVQEWETQLQSETFSGKTLSDEEFDGINQVNKFDEYNQFLSGTIEGLDVMRRQFTSTGFPSAWGYITAILCYLALTLPYLIQPRNSKNWYRLIGYAPWYDRTYNSHLSESNNQSEIVYEKTRTTRNKSNNYENHDGEIHFDGIENI